MSFPELDLDFSILMVLSVSVFRGSVVLLFCLLFWSGSGFFAIVGCPMSDGLELEAYPEAAVREQIDKALEHLEDGRKSMEQKSSVIFGVATSMMTLFSGFSLLTSEGAVEKITSAIVVGGFCATAGWMLWHATNLWGPTKVAVFDAQEPNDIYDRYLTKSSGESYTLIMKDLCSMFRQNLSLNQTQAKHLLSMVKILMIQIGLLTIGTIVLLIA